MQVWNRDIDRLGPNWIIEALSEGSGTPIQVAYETTLRSYEGWLFPAFRAAGSLQWITTLKMFHRTRQGFGMQYCPQCLYEDEDPFFRKAWRVAFITTCPAHRCMLRDRCIDCGAGVAFHRGDIGCFAGQHRNSIADCYSCGGSLTRESGDTIEAYDSQVLDWLSDLSLSVLNFDRSSQSSNIDVMRQMAVLLTSRFSTMKLHAHVCQQLAVPEMSLAEGRTPIETRSLKERHHLIQLIAWLMMDLQPRLNDAWRAKAVRYNHMLKDFKRAPQGYLDTVSGFSDWRR